MLGTTFSEIRPGERVRFMHCTDDSLSVELIDGRTITAPLTWYPRLLHATAKQRGNRKIAWAGYHIQWPDVDEDLSTGALLRGIPSPHSTQPAK